jgi:phosphoribosyl 1,2-cyclic phosphate phosphodiesterase
VTPVELLILGSGTSQGIPAIGCGCDTCTSSDPRDRRSRPSALFTAGGKRLLVDTSSDFREQMLRHGVPRIDAVLLTHSHFDHIGGFDDMRQYNFIQKEAIPVYGRGDALAEMRTTFRYAFGESIQEGGGVPQAMLIPVADSAPFDAAGVPVTPVPGMHGILPVLGFRVGAAAYLTDVNAVPEESFGLLRGLDALVLDALRHRPHPTHFCLSESIEIARRIGAKRTWFTHIAHSIRHERDSALLPDGMRFAHDGLLIRSPEVPA